MHVEEEERRRLWERTPNFEPQPIDTEATENPTNVEETPTQKKERANKIREDKAARERRVAEAEERERVKAERRLKRGLRRSIGNNKNKHKESKGRRRERSTRLTRLPGPVESPHQRLLIQKGSISINLVLLHSGKYASIKKAQSF